MPRINEWFYPAGSLAAEGWQSVVDDGISGWRHTGLRVGELDGGARLPLPGGAVERIVVPLTGSVRLEITDPDGGSRTVELDGRANVFDGPTDTAYLTAGDTAVVSGTGRVAVAEAPTSERRASRVIERDAAPVELRGAGRSSRQVHNFGTPQTLDAAKLIVCEVITPAENWSSYPAHKHDEHVPGVESALEEIYYFECAVTRGATAPEGAEPFGLFSTYSSAAGEIDTSAMVHTGDVALVPFGFHGPAAAAPGYDLYYLNVMAGPGERVWNITDDPAHAWVRAGWAAQDLDPRLPYTRSQHTKQQGERR